MIASALPVDPTLPLIPGAVLQHCMEWTTLRFDAPRLALSSAVVGGGLAEVGRWLNLRVSGEPITETPARTVARLCEARGWREPTLAMLTAASMKSLRVRRATLCGVDLAVLATTGLGNARRAGDRAEYRHLGEGLPAPGTINLAVLCGARLDPAVMVEMVLTATEAKAAALQDLDVRSPLSGGVATGTGTDAIAVFGGAGPGTVHHAGKHTLFGEQLARLTLAAIGDSIRQRGPFDSHHLA
ncbi:MAG: adenosylcobinamide amidohydrolase [Pseudomonadota bacterium]|nr:adenosylcobinamide amidohydrolase [Pseudomonadota bacterium]